MESLTIFQYFKAHVDKTISIFYCININQVRLATFFFSGYFVLLFSLKKNPQCF